MARWSLPMPTPDKDPLAVLAARAVAGNAAALDELCRELQQPIYRLALRMFSNPDDAADATQEALIRVVTNLASFQGRSQLTTWAYTVASRHFLRMRVTATERSVAGAIEFGQWIDQHRSAPSADTQSSVEFDELCGEVRIACTYGMLLCLSRPVRLAYLLGDVVGFTDTDGAEACNITPAAFRQRLARARRTMRSILAGRCGLIDPSNPCRCAHLVEASITAGILDPTQPHFARHPGTVGPIPHRPLTDRTVTAAAEELDVAVAIGELYRADPAWLAPAAVMERISAALSTLIQS
jgi:RNA polymerase sigma factor (sigma-70 family)